MTFRRLFQFFVAFSVAMSAATANAETIGEVCTAALEAEGESDFSGCTCLQEQVAGNSALEDELISLRDLAGYDERYSAASDDGKAALDACFS